MTSSPTYRSAGWFAFLCNSCLGYHRKLTKPLEQMVDTHYATLTKIAKLARPDLVEPPECEDD